MMQVYNAVFEATLEQSARFGWDKITFVMQKTAQGHAGNAYFYFYSYTATSFLLILLQIDTYHEEQSSGIPPNRRGCFTACICALSNSEEQRRKPNDAFQKGVCGKQTFKAPSPAK